MIKTYYYLDCRKKDSDKPMPLKLVLYDGKQRVSIPVNISLLKKDWDQKRQEVVSGSSKLQLNTYLKENKITIDSIKIQLERLGAFKGKSLLEIKNRILMELSSQNGDESKEEKHKEDPNLFVKRYEQFASSRDAEGTRVIYKRTLERIKAYIPNGWEKLKFEDIDVNWLREFDAHLAKTSLARNARNIHFRNIRAVFNDALDDEIITCYPFRKFKLKYDKTRKRSVPLESLRSLLRKEETGSNARYLDCFKMIFFLCGINIVDLCHLKELYEGRAEYTRAKTHRQYSIKVEPEALAIIEKYKGDKFLLNFCDTNKDYRSFYKHLADYLRTLGISTYWARHSWATIAAEIDIPDPVISQGLGHGPENPTTEIYIDRNRKKVDEANRKIIDFVLYGKDYRIKGRRKKKSDGIE
ncbi:MAG: site-specific integrase [Muribaculaceae bacterium]|nr:site-specific integrase [Muribaculaceae bacterium]